LDNITAGPTIVKPTHGWCNNEATSILVVNINTLFKALKPTTPHSPKVTVTAYLTKPNFYKKLSNISLLNLKTCWGAASTVFGLSGKGNARQHHTNEGHRHNATESVTQRTQQTSKFCEDCLQ
jgi:hypothetical protein